MELVGTGSWLNENFKSINSFECWNVGLAK